MKNWFATANFMYRHVFVKSFASSASLVVVRIVLAASVPNSSAARSAATSSSAPMICGSEWSSSRAWPSAIRSGQKATSTTAAALGEVLGDVGRRGRVDGASKGDERALAEERRDLVDRLLEDRHRRAEELVDRRPDDDDERHRPRDHDRRSVPSSRRPVGEDLAQQVVGAGLEERHLARGDPVERRLVGVVDADAQAGAREREAQRQPDVAAAAEDDDVEVRVGFDHGVNLAADGRADGVRRRSDGDVRPPTGRTGREPSRRRRRGRVRQPAVVNRSKKSSSFAPTTAIETAQASSCACQPSTPAVTFA